MEKGSHHTEKARQKLSESHKGLTGWWTGKSLSEKHRLKLSLSHKGKILSEEQKQKIGKAHRGKIRREGTGGKISRALMGKSHGPLSEEHKRKVSEGLKGLIRSEETRKKMSESTKKQFASMTKEQREKRIKNIIKASFKRPTNPEKIMNKLLNKFYPGEWKYVGDGSFIIAGKNPDFINVNGAKKIIEVFGNHWHKIEDEEKRKEIFKIYGYETLVIWENEINNPEELKSKIHSFVI